MEDSLLKIHWGTASSGFCILLFNVCSIILGNIHFQEIHFSSSPQKVKLCIVEWCQEGGRAGQDAQPAAPFQEPWEAASLAFSSPTPRGTPTSNQPSKDVVSSWARNSALGQCPAWWAHLRAEFWLVHEEARETHSPSFQGKMWWFFSSRTLFVPKPNCRWTLKKNTYMFSYLGKKNLGRVQ